MTFSFDDMTKAVEDYPLSYVDLEIVEVTEPGSVLNTNDEGTFRVKVTNRGPLNLTDVTVHVYGQNGATVADNTAVAVGSTPKYVSDFIPDELPSITGHGGSQETVGSPLKYKAPKKKQASMPLIKASLEGWNANLDHILIGHSDPVPTDYGTYAAEVVAQ